jgi:TolA-binding protein
MFPAEAAFSKDSFDLALNGNGLTKGFLDIKKKYSFTKAANLANYYIGICYINKKDYKNAIDALGSFSTGDPILGAAKLNVIGDAYANENKTEEATKYYRKAADFSDNEVYTPFYLLKLGMYLEVQKKYNDAKEAYSKIKDKYPNTQEGREIDKYLARVNVEG